MSEPCEPGENENVKPFRAFKAMEKNHEYKAEDSVHHTHQIQEEYYHRNFTQTKTSFAQSIYGRR